MNSDFPRALASLALIAWGGVAWAGCPDTPGLLIVSALRSCPKGQDLPQSACSSANGSLNSEALSQAMELVAGCPNLIGVELPIGSFPISRSIDIPPLRTNLTSGTGMIFTGTPGGTPKPGTVLYMNAEFMKNVALGYAHSSAMLRIKPVAEPSSGPAMTVAQKNVSRLQVSELKLRMSYGQGARINPWTPTRDPFEYSSGGGGIGVDLSYVSKGIFRRVFVESDETLPYSVGFYGRGSALGDSPYYNQLSDFSFNGNGAGHSIGVYLAQDLVVTPDSTRGGMPLYESIGANNNLIRRGVIDNAAIGIWFVGIANAVSNVKMERISLSPYVVGSANTWRANNFDGLLYVPAWKAVCGHAGPQCPVDCLNQKPMPKACQGREVPQAKNASSPGNVIFSGPVSSDSPSSAYRAIFLPGATGNAVYRNSLSRQEPGLAAKYFAGDAANPTSNYERADLQDPAPLRERATNNRVVCPGTLSNERGDPGINPDFNSATCASFTQSM